MNKVSFLYSLTWNYTVMSNISMFTFAYMFIVLLNRSLNSCVGQNFMDGTVTEFRSERNGRGLHRTFLFIRVSKFYLKYQKFCRCFRTRARVPEYFCIVVCSDYVYICLCFCKWHFDCADPLFFKDLILEFVEEIIPRRMMSSSTLNFIFLNEREMHFRWGRHLPRYKCNASINNI